MDSSRKWVKAQRALQHGHTSIVYCTITINSAGGGTRDGVAEIWASATLKVDRGHDQILVKAKVRPLAAGRRSTPLIL